MKTDSTRRDSRGKARPKLKKPSPDFELGIHQATGYWCKKVRGRVYYFGKVADDPKGKLALKQWYEDCDALRAGRDPRAETHDGLRVVDLCNLYIVAKRDLRDNGELNPRTYQGYFATCETVWKRFGRGRAVVDLTPEDFRKLRKQLAKTRGAVALGNEIQRVRMIFKFAFDQGHILAPIRFGQVFKKPDKVVARRAREAHRAEHGDRMFEAVELQQILNGKTATDDDGKIVKDDNGKEVFLPGAKQPLRAMILLAANSGFGQTDLSSLPTRAVDLDAGWVDFARVKTAVQRRVPLWPETVEAIREWIPQRPKVKDPADAGLLFLTCRGQRWVKMNKSGSPADALGQEFAKLLRALGIKRSRVSFYALRHTFETIAGDTADQVAVDAVMGHVPKGMAAAYRERIDDARLQKVVNHVRAWLFAENAPEANNQS